MHLNRSLNNKLDSLKQLLNSLYLPFQIIGLTETWLNDTNDAIFELDIIMTLSMQTEPEETAEEKEFTLQKT